MPFNNAGMNVINPETYSGFNFAGTANSGTPTSSLGGMPFDQIGSLGLQGLSGLSQLLGAFGAFGQNKQAKKQLGLMRDQFSFAKDMANKNYSNQLSAFNTALEDRIRSRSVMEGRDEPYVQEYLQKHSLGR